MRPMTEGAGEDGRAAGATPGGEMGVCDSQRLAARAAWGSWIATLPTVATIAGMAACVAAYVAAIAAQEQLNDCVQDAVVRQALEAQTELLKGDMDNWHQWYDTLRWRGACLTDP
jgi:hypothetical protein